MQLCQFLTVRSFMSLCLSTRQICIRSCHTSRLKQHLPTLHVQLVSIVQTPYFIFPERVGVRKKSGSRITCIIEEHLCTNPKRFFKNLIALPLSAVRCKLTISSGCLELSTHFYVWFFGLLALVNTFVCHIIACMMI
jgi:hypothetical protein